MRLAIFYCFSPTFEIACCLIQFCICDGKEAWDDFGDVGNFEVAALFLDELNIEPILFTDDVHGRDEIDTILQNKRKKDKPDVNREMKGSSQGQTLPSVRRIERERSVKA
ncbi:hypothetical protein VNO77_30824 [Canavalia gladiata]|uniref:Uncharacterized protein n=1 Tax=Canavalia gladiata TaxID=3824 RepID=A0AAN9Q1J2_CANGL